MATQLTVGFAGTRYGMTTQQMYHVTLLLAKWKSKGGAKARHGLCVGADAQFHHHAKSMGFYIMGHPGVRYDGKCFTRAKVECDETLPEKSFIERDKDIVIWSDVMITTPQGEEQLKGSGTWVSIRYTRKLKKPLYILMPDGEVRKENGAE